MAHNRGKNAAGGRRLSLLTALHEAAASFRLTAREREVVVHLTVGLSNKEIAERCGISEQTVKDHLKHVYQKIGAHQRTAIVARLLGLEDGVDVA